MPDFLLELFSEEIPARMQRRAAEDLRKLVTDGLVERGFLYEGAKAYATPRRLALNVVGLPAKGKDVREERRGPRVGAPESAVQGFLKSAGLASLDEARIEKDPKKGEFYVAAIERPGRPTAEVLAELLPAVIRDFPWPKSMRWGAASREPGSLRWVRPLHAIVCTFGPETETPEVVPFEVGGIRAGDVTRGHRFMAPEPIQVRRFADYARALERAKVVLDAERRKDVIATEAKNLAFAKGLELVEDEVLLEEVAGLVEWPVVLMGAFDEAFLDMPAEVIRATIRANQKCFVTRNPSPFKGEGRLGQSPSGARGAPPPLPSPGSASRPSPPSPLQGEGQTPLSNAFILISNLEAKDGGAAIVAGNERVVRARLSDAKFFWDTDRKVPLEARLEKLKSIVFHEKLGTQYERVERIAALAAEIAETQPFLGWAVPTAGLDIASSEADREEYRNRVRSFVERVRRAARLAKADLVTEMVGEFPELQGLMGRTYATLQGEDPSVAAAIEEHYKPLGPSDRVPTDPVSVAVALADKLDTLVGFWAIDEKPTGSKDPYALRRAALGVIRILTERLVRVSLGKLFRRAYLEVLSCWAPRNWPCQIDQSASVGFNSHLLEPVDIPSRHRTEMLNTTGCFVSLDVTRPVYLIATNPPEGAERHWRFGRVAFDGDVEQLPLRFSPATALDPDLLSFFADRLKVHLREEGARHDLIDAVFALGATAERALPPREGRAETGASAPARVGATRDDDEEASSFRPTALAPEGASRPSPRGEGQAPAVQDDLLIIVRRVEALGRFLETEDGRNLLAGYRRAANILRIEEKKDGRAYDAAPDIHLLRQPEELALWEALVREGQGASHAVAAEDFEGAMLALSRLRPPVDAFFDKVTVNAEDAGLRENRLKLLNALRAATREVADFSRIEG